MGRDSVARREHDSAASPEHAVLPVLGVLDTVMVDGFAEHERVDQALALVRQGVRTYLDAVGVIVVALDRDGRVLFVNRRGCELLGCTTDAEIIGKDWIESFIPERLRPETRAVLDGLWAGDVKGNAAKEMEIVTRSGEERTVTWSNGLLRDASGTVWAAVGSGVDVTERRAAETERARVNHAVEAAHDGLGMMDLEGRVVYMNPALRALTGYTPEALEAAGGPPVLFSNSGAGRAAFLWAIRDGVWSGEVTMRTRAGDEIVVILRASVVYDDRGMPLGLVGVHTDVTERRRLEAEVMRVADEERQRLGRDLHDGLGSHLVGLGMLVRGLARDARTAAPELAASLAEVAELIGAGAEQARSLAHGLNPVHVDREGLTVALARLAASTDALSDVACTFAKEASLPPLRSDVAVQLYRIAQEAVTNALRHAEAERIEVRVSADAASVVLTVRDDGLGLRTPSPHEAGLGLQTMDYRARAIGAAFEIRERATGGVEVTCRLSRTRLGDTDVDGAQAER